jgi:HEAT repeat protein
LSAAQTPAEAVFAYTKQLKSEDKAVRLKAAWELGNFGTAAKSAVPTLAGLLREDKEKDVRTYAGQALAQIGPAAVPALTDALKDADAGVRYRAARALGLIGPEAKAALPALVEALQDKDDQVRAMAAHSLGEMGDEAQSAAAALVQALRDRAPEVRLQATSALAQLGPVALPVLGKALDDPDRIVRLEAIQALELLGALGEDVVPALTKALRDSDSTVRLAAVQALDQPAIDAPAALRALQGALSDKEPAVRLQALNVIQAIMMAENPGPRPGLEPLLLPGPILPPAILTSIPLPGPPQINGLFMTNASARMTQTFVNRAVKGGAKTLKVSPTGGFHPGKVIHLPRQEHHVVTPRPSRPYSDPLPRGQWKPDQKLYLSNRQNPRLGGAPATPLHTARTSPPGLWAPVSQKFAEFQQLVAQQTLREVALKTELLLKDQEQRLRWLGRIVRELRHQSKETLAECLTVEDATTRWLAALVIGARRLHLERDLIDRLRDPSPLVAEAVHQALVRLARGCDFGPQPSATTDQRAQAIARWRSWLAMQDPPAQGPFYSSELRSVAGAAPSPLEPITVSTREKPDAMAGRLRTDSEATRLSKQLLEAPTAEQEATLSRLRDGKGIEYTQALAAAIGQLKGEPKNKARDALAERLAQMTADTLRDKLQDKDLEVRRAAALACALKEDQAHIPDLIGLLDDPEVAVMRAARAALRELTSEDFGPDANASRAEQAIAVAAWKQWWAKRQLKQ